MDIHLSNHLFQLKRSKTKFEIIIKSLFSKMMISTLVFVESGFDKEKLGNPIIQINQNASSTF
eukprot:UN20570